MVARSYLYVPATAGDKLAKVLQRGADAVIVDLEDAVPFPAKDGARADVVAWLEGLDGRSDVDRRPAGPPDVEIWVRLNAGEPGLVDAAAVAAPRVAGVMLAKTETREEIDALDAVLTDAEQRRGLPSGSIGVVPLLESAAALLRAPAIAAGPRVVRLQVGEADLAADLGFGEDADDADWAPIRSQIVVTSAAAGISAPVAPVSTDFRDLDALAASTRALARRGYVGRACIHPAQVSVVNDVFTPSEQRLAAARALIATFDRAVEAGQGVIVGPDGRMIDEAVVRRARNLVALAR
ncbi:citrate lyase subunit beta/citryl-CoA lyase [Mumia flava]|uniref:Citrate lyase subunit beta/citryl-CoA lyase n=1 Tax=Mumia flava TaxID=1348852 RepID=A0A0B2BLC3_9ACTN|nr:CoA ester lyase [Mumia flava]PJJ56344.1 citrate lyase subunit beta/citryl-CoA lyase [Mumia flava]